MRYAALLLALACLAGCSFAPLAIGVKNYSSDVALFGNGVAAFQKADQTQTPPTPVQSIQIEGSVAYQQQNVTLEFYASDGPPCGTQVGGVYTCAPSAATQSIGEVSFASGAAQTFKWSGGKLTDGVNKGTLYIGVRLKSGVLTGGTLQFSNMVARVVVF